MDPVPSVHLLIGCFGKLLHAGLNNKETIKRLRGAGKDKEAMAIGNPANITQDICYPVTRGDRALGQSSYKKKKKSSQWSAERDRVSKRVHCWEHFHGRNFVWRLCWVAALASWCPPVGEAGFPKSRRKGHDFEVWHNDVCVWTLPFTNWEIQSKWFYLSEYPALHLWNEKLSYLSRRIVVRTKWDQGGECLDHFLTHSKLSVLASHYYYAVVFSINDVIVTKTLT